MLAGTFGALVGLAPAQASPVLDGADAFVRAAAVPASDSLYAEDVVLTVVHGSDAEIYWDGGNLATLSPATDLADSLIAEWRIPLNTASSVGCGPTIAPHAPVTTATGTVSIVSMACRRQVDFAVPEPASWALAGLALALLPWRRRSQPARPRGAA